MASKADRPVFRREPLRHDPGPTERVQAPGRSVPHGLALVWLGVMALAGIAIVPWFAEIPVYVTGKAMIVHQDRLPPWLRPRGGNAALVAFFREETRHQLRAGQRLIVDLGSGDELDRPLVVVNRDPRVLDALRSLAGGAEATPPVRTVVTAIAGVEDAMSERLRVCLPSASCQARVEVGSQRLVSLLIPAAGDTH